MAVSHFNDFITTCFAFKNKSVEYSLWHNAPLIAGSTNDRGGQQEMKNGSHISNRRQLT